MTDKNVRNFGNHKGLSIVKNDAEKLRDSIEWNALEKAIVIEVRKSKESVGPQRICNILATNLTIAETCVLLDIMKATILQQAALQDPMAILSYKK